MTETSDEKIVVAEGFCGETFWFVEKAAQVWCFSSLQEDSQIFLHKSSWILIRHSVFNQLGKQISEMDALAWFLKHSVMPPTELAPIANRVRA